jgi:hypothetical protein
MRWIDVEALLRMELSMDKDRCDLHFSKDVTIADIESSLAEKNTVDEHRWAFLRLATLSFEEKFGWKSLVWSLGDRADGSLVVTEAEQEEIVSIIGRIKLKTKVFSLTDLSLEWKCSSIVATRREWEDRGQTEEINDEFQQLRNISRRNEQITTVENLDEGNWQYKRVRDQSMGQ